MKKLSIVASLAGFMVALAMPAYSATVTTGNDLYGQQSTCEEGKTWNESTQQCE